MTIIYNLSFDTINCPCCKNNPRARVRLSSEDFFKDCKYLSYNKFWICQRRKVGAFPSKLITFRNEKFRQKKLGLEASKRNDKVAETEHKSKELALKILLNGGYGCFGHPYFRYYNPPVAEAVTTFGRYTLSKMQDIAKKLGFKIIYGDTDSLFFTHVSKSILQKFKNICEKRLNITLEDKSKYSKLILSEGKKHYIGIGVDDKNRPTLDVVGFEGKKSD